MATSLNDKYKPEERYRAVVEHDNGILVVSAGPGTGKTFSLLRKIERLLDNDTNPTRIYYLTFVNSIVNAFKDDASAPKDQGGLGVDVDSLGIHVSTLHSLAFKIVKVYSDVLALPAHLEVIDLSPKPQNILSRIFVGDLFEYSKSQKISNNKKSFDKLLMRLTESWRKNISSVNCEKLEEAVTLFNDKYSVCSWDQLVLLAIRAISENGLPTWLQEAEHFMIDEYQDFNPAEQRLLELITEPSDSVVIVGDPDQSIYSGRSASPKGLTDLLAREDVVYVNFIHCRRCPRKVIVAANNILRFMDPAEYASKELQPFKDEDGNFTIATFKSCKAELQQIADFLKNFNATEKADTIILLPQAKIADYYANKLRELDIDCKVKDIDTNNELLLAVLRLIILHDQPFLQRMVLFCFSNVERKFKNNVLSIFMNSNSPFLDILNQAATNQKWRKEPKDSLSNFTRIITNLISGNIELIIPSLPEINIDVSREVITKLLASDKRLSAMERVELSLKVSDIEKPDNTSSDTSIKIMTMHSSKGLSKPFVIIPAFEEKLLPGNNEGERLAETHRLLYVAITRAKSQVVITFPKTRARKDPLNYPPPPKLSSYSKILLR